MPTQTPTTDREHALDHLRAVMMWLGIVLHVAANHLTGPMLVPWRDKETSEWATLLGAVIHVFRMPVFLMLAGYFVALLVQRHGPRHMLVHRLRRIALPFVLFWPVLFAVTGLLVMLYVHRATHGHFGLSLEVLPSVPHMPLVNTMHLWFLYQLTGLVGLTFIALKLAPRLPPGGCHRIGQVFRCLAARPWGLGVLALPLGLIGAQYPLGILMVSGSFAPPLSEWLHHGLFYAFGYGLYLHREALLPQLASRWGVYAGAGALLCVASIGLLQEIQRHPEAAGLTFRVLAAWGYNAATWLWSLALIGWALKHLHRPHARLRYLADSSYWVYLVHMLGTIGFGALLYGVDAPAEVKMVLNITATTALCLVSYQFGVRHTALGAMLNGRRIPPTPQP